MFTIPDTYIETNCKWWNGLTLKLTHWWNLTIVISINNVLTLTLCCTKLQCVCVRN